MKLGRGLVTAAAVLFAAAIAVPGQAGDYGKKKDIVDTAVSAGDFETLATALTEAGLVEALKGKGPFTVFAPTDEAFAKLPKGTVETLLKPENRDKLVAILTYHVVEGNVMAADVGKLKAAETLNGQRIDIDAGRGGVKVDDASVIKADVKASNGIIHVIDAVLLPTEDDIVDVAKGAGKFETLLAAAKAAGLVDALKGEGPLTVFAPTDDAFAKLPEGTVESLLKKENLGRLAAILKYHVVQGRVFSDKALKSGSAKTLQGEALNVTLKGGKAMVNEAGLVATDIDASNGVIHVIDSVLLPPERSSYNSSSGCQHDEKKGGTSI